MSLLHTSVRYLPHALVSYMFKVFCFISAERSCPVVQPPVYGAITSLSCGSTYGSRATIACNEGHRLVGSRTRSCEANGTWSGSTTTCESKNLKKTQHLTRLQASITTSPLGVQGVLERWKARESLPLFSLPITPCSRCARHA